MTKSEIWRLSPGARLFWRSWGHEWVVFNKESGDTHMLDEIAAAGLALFEKSGHNVQSFCLELSNIFHMEPDDRLGEYAQELIGRLHYLGLIEIDTTHVE